jgi:hypothetical protein
MLFSSCFDNIRCHQHDPATAKRQAGQEREMGRTSTLPLSSQHKSSQIFDIDAHLNQALPLSFRKSQGMTMSSERELKFAADHGDADIATTRIYDHRRAGPENSPAFLPIDGARGGANGDGRGGGSSGGGCLLQRSSDSIGRGYLRELTRKEGKGEFSLGPILQEPRAAIRLRAWLP